MLTTREFEIACQCYGGQDLPADLRATLISTKTAWSRVVAGQLPTESIATLVGLYGAILTKQRPPNPWDTVQAGENVIVVESNRQGSTHATFVGRCNSPEDDYLIVDIFGDPDSRRKLPMWQVCIPGRILLATERADGTKIELPKWVGELGVPGGKILDESATVAESDADDSSGPIAPVVGQDTIAEGDTVLVAPTDGSEICEGVFLEIAEGGLAEVLIDGKSRFFNPDDLTKKKNI